MRSSISHSGRALAALLIVAAALTGCRGSTSRKPPVHPNTNMDNVAYISAQEPSDFFEDGRGNRQPVEGTVAQGMLNDDPAFDTGIVDGQYVDDLPEGIALSDELLERGEERYEIYCTPCHGSAGHGRGAVPARAEAGGVTWIVPSFHDEQRQAYSVGRIYNVATDGWSTMMGYRAQIPAEDRWAIAAWVKALQLTQDVEQDQVPQEVRTEQGWE